VSKALQTETIDLMTAHELLENAHSEVSSMRQSFEEFVKEACDLYLKLGIPSQFSEKKKCTENEKNILMNYV